MSIKIFTSHQLENLFTQLATHLQKPKSFTDIFSRPMILISSPQMKKWLYLELAQRQGIAADLDLDFLESGLDRMIGHRSDKEQMLEVQLALFTLLKSDFDKPELAVFKRILTEKREGKEGLFSLRNAWLLAVQLGGYFREYEYHLQEVLRSKNWERLPDVPMKKAQVYLYQRLKKKLNSDYLFIPYGVESVNTGIKELHIFGFSQVSRAHGKLLAALGNNLAVFVYHLDLEGGNSSHPLLAGWGRAGRESLKILREELLSGLFTTEESLPVTRKWSHNLLALLQQNLGSNTELNEKVSQDKSLQIIGAPGAYREVETVYQSILANLDEDKTLKLSDVAVLVTDMNAYAPLIEQIFSAEKEEGQRLAFQLQKGTGTESHYVSAVKALLDLVRRDFSREAFTELVTQPCFLEALGLSREDAEVFLGWVKSLNIYHNLKLSEPAIHTWSWGASRLRLGRLMESPVNGDLEEELEKEFEELIPYADGHSSDELNARFSLIIEDLFERLSTLKDERLSVDDWLTHFYAILEDYLGIPEAYVYEERIKSTLLEKLSLLKTLESTEKSRITIDLDLIWVYLEAIISELKGSRFHFLSGGVSIVPWASLRTLPFRVIYVLGLGEGLFPGLEDRSTLDLRNLLDDSEREKLGILSNVDKDRYLFLETLLSAREKLYLSFNQKNLAKDQELFPSSVIYQLLDYLNKSILKEPYQVIPVPLNGYSLDSEELSKKYESFKRISDVFAFYREPVLESLLEPEKKWELPSLAAKENRKRIKLNELSRFLENPLRVHLQRGLGIFLQEAESDGQWETESFQSEFPLDYEMLKIALQHELFVGEGEDTSHSDEDFMDRYYRFKQLSGDAPLFHFGRLDKKGLLDEVKNRLDVNLPEGIKKAEPLRLELGLESLGENWQDWILEGEWLHSWSDSQTLNLYVFVKGNSAKNHPSRHILLPFLFYTATKAFNEDHKKARIYALYRDGLKVYEYDFKQEEARQYLGDLLEDFILKQDFSFFPFELLDKNLKSDAHAYQQKLEQLVEEESEKADSVILSDLERILPLSVPENAHALALRRLGLFLRQGDESEEGNRHD